MELTPQVHKLDRPVYERFSDMASAYGLRAAETPPDPNYTLEEGKSIEFGNTKLDVHFMPGHCPGHVVLSVLKKIGFLAGMYFLEAQ